MNEHIKLGNEAIRRGDSDTAIKEFYEALNDPSTLTQRIARNRLMELCPETVYASTHSYQALYHRPNCSAKNVIQARHIKWYKDWNEAEANGHVPCQTCRPSRIKPSQRG